MRTPAALLIAALAACGTDRPDPAPGAGTPTEELAAAATNAIAFVAGGDTIALETFEQGADQLYGELRDRDSGARAQYVARVGADGRVNRIDISAFENRDPSPRSQATIVIEADTLVAEQRDRNGDVHTERLALPPGTRLYLNPSIGMLEQLVQEAGGAGSVHVLQVSMTDSPRLVQAQITRSGEQVEIRAADAHIILRVDGNGRILTGTTEGGRVELHRIR
jgi:uncharacterized lipoprotein YbaY